MASVSESVISNEIIAFDTLCILAIVLLVACILPVLLTSSIQRSKVWHGLLASWLAYSLSYIILMGHQSGPSPPHTVCVFQTLVIYGAPAVGSVGTACYIIEVFLLIKSSASNSSGPSQTVVQLLVLLPWMIFLSVFAETTFFIATGSVVSRSSNRLYCHLESVVPSIVTTVIVVIAAVTSLALEVTLFYRNIFTARRNRLPINFSVPGGRAIYIRMGFFTMMLFLGILIGILSFFVNTFSIEWGIVLPTAPILVALSFATQKDILRSWSFCYTHCKPS
ncbi:hypothetical protein BDQ12DRAFT_497213 [Crucibulum laeve]|uniref:Uncharacterized protein n=1 Tax=Crucibulum laeve TaxID=68775 RepID=A0A5C3M9A1_9AGAR|nr:hypothetical protein BDQ12DRAFT_497213 [Crucibulum laeve]